MTTLATSFLIGSSLFLQVMRTTIKSRMGAQWLSGRVLDSRPKGRGFETHRRHCVVSLSKNINPSLVLVQPRKTRPFITDRLLMGRKESNQTNKNKISDGFEFRQDWTRDLWVSCPWGLEKSPYTYNGRNVVTNLVRLFLDGSSSFLQITRPTIIAGMSLNFCKIPSLTSELAALERQKN